MGEQRDYYVTYGYTYIRYGPQKTDEICHEGTTGDDVVKKRCKHEAQISRDGQGVDRDKGSASRMQTWARLYFSGVVGRLGGGGKGWIRANGTSQVEIREA